MQQQNIAKQIKVLPGQTISTDKELEAGYGTLKTSYNRIISTMQGVVQIDQQNKKIEVVPLKQISQQPMVGDIVYCKVTGLIYDTGVKALIQAIVYQNKNLNISVQNTQNNQKNQNDQSQPMEIEETQENSQLNEICLPLPHDFLAVIRKQDIRSYEIDRVKVEQTYMPGDIVKAEVISLGDSQRFYLGTANENLGLGVVYARCRKCYGQLAPLTNEAMICVDCGKQEGRKTARPEGIES